MNDVVRDDLTVHTGNVIYPPGELIPTFWFSRRLQHRGTDFSVYANRGYTRNTKDTDLLAKVIEFLLRDDVPVEEIRVTAYSITVHANSTTTVVKLMNIIVDACRESGHSVEYEV